MLNLFQTDTLTASNHKGWMYATFTWNTTPWDEELAIEWLLMKENGQESIPPWHLSRMLKLELKQHRMPRGKSLELEP